MVEFRKHTKFLSDTNDYDNEKLRIVIVPKYSKGVVVETISFCIILEHIIASCM